MDLLVISNYWHFESEKASSRYLTIANMAADAEIEVEVITSTFYHANKKQREISKRELDSYKYKTTLIKEPGYKKNIDPKRIISHKVFADNVLAYLKKEKSLIQYICLYRQLVWRKQLLSMLGKTISES